LIKKLTKTAKMRIMPPNSNGDCVVKVYAEEYKEVELDLCLNHKAAMELLFSMLMENQVGDARQRLYKH